MQAAIILSPVLSFYLSLLTLPGLEACLPSGMKLTDTISAQVISSDSSGSIVKRLTVKDKLTALKARCRKGRLVDRRGKQIYFYRLTGCWGNPPANYREIMDRQRSELTKLKQRYTVIEISCNTSGLLIQ